nr:lysophospholipid acyltransferase family protein [Maliibacterium massiliense]
MRDKSEKSNKRHLYQPVGWFYRPLAHIVRMLMKLLFRLRIDCDADVKALKGTNTPVIVLSQHPSFLDVAVMDVGMYPRMVSIVTAGNLFRYPKTAKIIRMLGGLPKAQFRSDLQAMRGMLGVLRAGGVLGIMPEGRLSMDGTNCAVGDSIAHFAHKTGAAVVALQVYGSYFCLPSWSDNNFRFGKIEGTFRLLASPQEMQALSTAELDARIRRAMTYNQYDWNAQHRHHYWAWNPARNVTGVVHQCPACGRSFAMQQSGRHSIDCQFCGNSVRLDSCGFFKPNAPEAKLWPDVASWNAWQQRNLRAYFTKNANAALENDVRVHIFKPDEGRVLDVGCGRVRLNRAGFCFEGELEGEARAIVVPLAQLPGVSADYRGRFTVYAQEGAYMFFPADPQFVGQLVNSLVLLRSMAGMEIVV